MASAVLESSRPRVQHLRVDPHFTPVSIVFRASRSRLGLELRLVSEHEPIVPEPAKSKPSRRRK